MNVGHDLSRIIKFATRDDWAEALHDALSDHVGAAMEEFNLEFDEIGDIISDHYTGVLFGCALEDLMTRRFEPNGENLVDDYLKRRYYHGVERLAQKEEMAGRMARFTVTPGAIPPDMVTQAIGWFTDPR